MSYDKLTTASIPHYLKTLEAMQAHFSDFENLNVQEVGDGNLNYVYLITNRDKPSETVALKQAVPYLRVLGESFPLSRERMRIEIQALETQKRLCPDHVPDLYYHSQDMSLVIMRNLNQHRILRKELVAGKTFPQLADHMSAFLASTLFHTSDWFLEAEEKKQAVSSFINAELCGLTENFVFTYPFEKHETNAHNEALTEEAIRSIQEDGELKVAVAEMKYTFMNKAEAMIHGDLHTGSLMVNQEETLVIDPEFSFYGPMGFDMGAFLGNLFLAYFAHDVRQKLLERTSPEYRNWILDTIASIWNLFAEKFDRLWVPVQAKRDPFYFDYPDGQDHAKEQRRRFIDQVFSDSLGFAGCKMMRRIIGIAKVEDIAGIENLKDRARVERMALQFAKELVIRREAFNSIEDVVEQATTISPLE